MPKLSKEKAQRVADNESTGFEALPEGPYKVKLVEVTTGEGQAGPYWTWKLEVVSGDHKGRFLWNTTSLSDNADWKLKEAFEAFGYTTDSDTDEIVGEECVAVVSQRIIERGARAGQTGNNVDSLRALDDDDESF